MSVTINNPQLDVFVYKNEKIAGYMVIFSGILRYSAMRIIFLLTFFMICRHAIYAEVDCLPMNTSSNQPETYQVDTVLLQWHDAKRGRDIPVKIYYPKDYAGICPVIVFSHGLGGSRQGYAYLGNFWAGQGYVSIHLQHLGSDDSLWIDKAPDDIMPAMRKAVADISNSLNRIFDVHFALDQLDILNTEEGVLKGRLDIQHIGMAGHSFGAFTTLAAIGEGFPRLGSRLQTYDDSRIKAAIAMSASPSRHREKLKKVYSGIDIPCFHMTGTLDDSPVSTTKAAERRLVYDNIDRPDQYLLTFEAGDHMVFSGRSTPGRDTSRDSTFHNLIQISTTAFWDAYLKNDKKALQWLTEGDFEKQLNGNGTFEHKE